MIDIAEETLDFRHLEFSSRDTLLMPAFSLRQRSTKSYNFASLRGGRSPTTRAQREEVIKFLKFIKKIGFHNLTLRTFYFTNFKNCLVLRTSLRFR